MEINRESVLEYKGIPELEFFKNEELDAEDIKNQQTVFIYLGKISQTPKFSFLNEYLLGLTLLSKNDLLFRVEITAFKHFYNALKEVLLNHNEWDGTSDLKDTIIKVFGPNEDTSKNNYDEMINEFQEMVDIGEDISNESPNYKELNIEKVFVLKACIDMYIIIQSKKSLNNDMLNDKKPV